MFAQCHSVLVRALPAKATGSSSSRMTAPRPILDASTWRVTGLLVLKYQSTEVLDIKFLMMLKCPS